MEEVETTRIVLKDRDNHDKVLGVLEVKNHESGTPADTLKKIEQMFCDYKYSTEGLDEEWSVEGFVDYLQYFRATPQFEISYDSLPLEMEV